MLQNETGYYRKIWAKYAVLLSYEDYQRLSLYKDLYWEKLAILASMSGFLGEDETQKRLDNLAKKAGIDIKNDD